MKSSPISRPPGAGGLLRDLLLPAAITVLALFTYLNGAFFSTVSALHVDLSINLTAAHAIRDGDNPYGEKVLLERARELGSPPVLGGPEPLLYQTLFTSYIQPPTSAIAVLPLTVLDWREATRAYLVLNNVLLISAVVLVLITVRPTVPARWGIAGAAAVVAGYSQLYGSFALGQVDATQTFLLALGLWSYSRGRHALTGAAIAAGVAVKLIPGLLLLYFLWKREYRVVAWGFGAGALMFLLSVPIAGIDTYSTYFTETVPALLKGSTHYSNISAAGVYARMLIDQQEPLGDLYSLREVPASWALRVVSITTALTALGALIAVIPRGRPAASEGKAGQSYVIEYYLVIAVGLVLSSVTWEFYTVWLLPLFLCVFLAPSRVLSMSGRVRWAVLLAFGLIYVGLNYPGDHYLFDVNGFFYHPDWVPGIVVEDIVNLYPLPAHPSSHVYLMPPLRLASLGALAVLLLLLAGRPSPLVLPDRPPGPGA